MRIRQDTSEISGSRCSTRLRFFLIREYGKKGAAVDARRIFTGNVAAQHSFGLLAAVASAQKAWLAAFPLYLQRRCAAARTS
jgi:hypothetical protein